MDRTLRILAVSALLSIACILLWQTVSPQDPPSPPNIVLPREPVHVHVWPSPEVPPGAEPESAPATRGARGRIDLAEVPGILENIEGLAVSPGRPTMAVHDDRYVWWTGDDGRSWERHTLPKGASVTRLIAADDGAVYAMLWSDPPLFWRFSPDGARTESKAPLPAPTLEWMAAGSGDLYLFGLRAKKGTGPVDKELVLLRSTDKGKSFQDAPVASLGNYGNQARVEKDGTLHVMFGQEASCGGGYQLHTTLSRSDAEWQSLEWPLDSPGSFWLGASGWAYGLGSCAPNGQTADSSVSRLCAVSPDKSIVPVPGPLADSSAFVAVVTNGRTTYAVVEKNLYSVAGGAFRRIANDVPDALRSSLQVDAKDRLIGLAAGRILRRSGHRWDVIWPQ